MSRDFKHWFAGSSYRNFFVNLFLGYFVVYIGFIFFDNVKYRSFFSFLLHTNISISTPQINNVPVTLEIGEQRKWGLYYMPSGGLTLIVGTQKMGVFLQSTEATPFGHLLKWKLTPENPPCRHHVHDRHGHGSPVKYRWRFSKFCKKYETLALTFKKSVSCKKMGLKSSHWSCLKACFKGYTFCLTRFLVRPSTGAQQSHERASKIVQIILKDQSFVNKFKVSFVFLPEDVRPTNFGKCLNMPQR